jgi:hypothetical protein
MFASQSGPTSFTLSGGDYTREWAVHTGSRGPQCTFSMGVISYQRLPSALEKVSEIVKGSVLTTCGQPASTYTFGPDTSCSSPTSEGMATCN